jgi:hypothetical protein
MEVTLSLLEKEVVGKHNLLYTEYYNNKKFPNDKLTKNNVDFMICTEETS